MRRRELTGLQNRKKGRVEVVPGVQAEPPCVITHNAVMTRSKGKNTLRGGCLKTEEASMEAAGWIASLVTVSLAGPKAGHE